ncbi:tetratricopeptide repeat protein [bacterium]|nr:MAG: tetratricopeptide repeat protein [bacterium]
MPKPIKKKIRKKTVVREEEVTSKIQKKLNVIKERQRILVYVLSALGIAVVLVVLFMFISSSARKDAYSYEIEAYDYYYQSALSLTMTDEERWKKALELFQKSSEAKPTPSVLFFTGNCYFNLGDYENAVTAYNTFIQKFSNEELMLPLVYQKLASTYLKQGKSDDAMKTLGNLTAFKNGIFRDSALILEARHYESAGQINEALKKYDEIIKHFPTSPWASEAQARISAEEEKEPSQESSEGATQSIMPEEELGKSKE